MTSPSSSKPKQPSGGGAAGPYSMGGPPASSPSLMYGGVSSNQRAPTTAPAGTGGGGAGMDGPAVMPGGMGSMYGMGAGSGYGNGYGQAGSMYGQNSMYGPAAGAPAAGGVPMGGANSMYGAGSMYAPGSMYGMGAMPPNTGHYTGSLYGGSLFGISGNLYSEGGSLYGNGSGRDIMGSMHGFGSMYETRPHTDLGSVQKIDIPWYSIVFGSMGTAGSEQNLSANPSFRGSIYDRTGSAASIGSGGSMSGYSAANASGRPASSTRSAASGGSVLASPSNRGASGTDKDGRSAKEEPSKTRGAKFTTKDDQPTKSDAPDSTTKRSSRSIGDIAEAPKSPHSTRTISGRGLVVAADHKIQVVGVIEKSTKPIVRVKATGKDENTLSVDGKNFPLSECLQYNPAEKVGIDSQRVGEVVDHLVAGHNTALFITDDGECDKSARAFTEGAVHQLLKKLNTNAKNGGTAFYLHFSACATRDSSASRDLLANNASYVAMDIGASPLFGTVVMNLKSVPISTDADFTSALKDMYGNMTSTEKTVFGWLVLRVVKPVTGAKSQDVFLSSMQLVISRNGAQPFLDALEKKSDKIPIDLFRYSLGGPGVTVATVCVLDSNSTADKLVESMQRLGSVSNAPPRSGNVRRFIEFTEQQHGKLKGRLTDAPPAERDDIKANCDRLQQIIDNAKTLLAKPATAEPGVYRSMRRPEEIPPALTYSTVKPPAKKATDSPSSPAVKTRGIDSLITPGGNTASSPSQQKDVNPIRAIAVVDSNEGRNFSVRDKDVVSSAVGYTMDDVLRTTDVKPNNFNSNVMTGVVSTFVKGSNVAIVSADSASLVKNVFDSPAWSAVIQAAHGCLSRTDTKSNALRASISIVRATGEAIDLVKGGTWQPLVVASSPLFGPIVHNAKLYTITTEAEFTKFVDKAKSNLGKNWGTDTAIYCSLVSCFSSSTDAYVSSLMASFCGTNTSVLNDAMQRRGSLADIYRYAFGGTAQCVYVVTLGKDDSTNDVASALNSQRTAKYIKNRQVRRGSVADFVKYTETALERRKRRAAEATDKREKEANQRVIPPMASMLADHKEVLRDPATHFPRAYAPDQGSDANEEPATEEAKAAQSPAAGFVESQVVAFVPRATTQTDRSVVVGSQEYAVDEVVQRITNASGTVTKPSIRMAELEKWFTAVHNCALVSASTVPSESLKEEPVWMYLRQIVLSTLAKSKPDEQVEMEFSFAMVSASELLGDLLAASPTSPTRAATPLAVASSPLFGPKVHGVTLSKAASAAQVEKIVDTALNNAMAFKTQLRNGTAMISCTVLQRRKSGKDVLVSSLTACHVQGPSVAAYKTVADQLDQRASLLGCSFGGPCSTIAVLNFEKEADPRNKEMTETLIGLAKQSRNLASRTGSIASFVRYTQNACDQDAAALKKTPSMPEDRAERTKRKMSRLQGMIKDHQRVLDDYSAPIPTYLNVTNNSQPAIPSAPAAPAAASPQAAAGSKAPAKAGSPTMKTEELSPNTVNKARKVEMPKSPATGAARSPGAGKPARSPQAGAGAAKASTPQAVAASPKVTSPQAKARTPSSQSVYPKHEGESAVKTVAIVTGSHSSQSSSTVQVGIEDQTHLTVKMSSGPKSFRFDETAMQPAVTDSVHSDSVNELIGSALAGYNVALLCTDQSDGATSAALAGRVIHALFSKLGPSSEVWMSLTAHKDDTWKDMQNIGSSFRELTLASSPLFGPAPFGSWLLQIRDSPSFLTVFSAAVAECIPAKAMCVACVVVKQIEGNDVCLSSVLLTVAGDGGAEYDRAATTNDKHKRGMFQYALGTACFTVCAFACPEQVNEDGLQRALSFHESIRGKNIGKLRNGSVRQFYKYISAQTKRTQSSLEKVTNDKDRSKAQSQLEKFKTMMDDCESLLSSPANVAPPVYKL